MIVRLLPRLIWAAALLVAAVLALVPSPASAHAGHVHVRVGDVHQQTPPAAAVAKAMSVQTVAAAATWPAPSADNSRCDDVGCCASGCTSCHGAVLNSSALHMPVRTLDPVTAADSLPPGGADAGRLKRPPKFFA
jgi:hypothetical protein